jgi:hypothetical protein
MKPGPRPPDLSKEVRYLVVVLCASLALAGLTAAAAGAGRPNPKPPNPNRDKAQVRSLLAYQTRLINQRRWAPLYRTYSPRVRARCPYRRFAAIMHTIRTLIGGRIAVRRLRVHVAEDEASATYEVVSRGRVVSRMTARRPDLYVRINGRWFDEADAGSPC